MQNTKLRKYDTVVEKNKIDRTITILKALP